MNKNCVFLFLLFHLSVSSETQESNLIVLDSNTKIENPIFLVKHTEEPLELICKLKNFTEENVSLSWELPSTIVNGSFKLDSDDNILNETSIIMRHDEMAENGTIKISINSLQESHKGIYTCVWTNGGVVVRQTVTIVIKSKKVVCGKKFECGGNQCIPIIFKCDGIVDCKNKSDESPDLCGVDPCHERVMCRNGRCIPKEWCKVCDPLKSNCTHRYRHECCPPLDPVPFPKGHPSFRDGSYSSFNDFPDSPNMQHQYDINFIQTTIYTIIGCALVFMIIVTILVIAICRVHLKRTQPAHILNNRRVFATTAYHRAFTQEIGVYDVDIAMNRCDGPGLLVTYNINNGVQIVGNPVDPPPYSEVASAPPREGPPPPYALAQPGEGELGRNVRSVQCETSPNPSNRPLRRGLTPHARVSSEPSLPNLDRL